MKDQPGYHLAQHLTEEADHLTRIIIGLALHTTPEHLRYAQAKAALVRPKSVPAPGRPGFRVAVDDK